MKVEFSRRATADLHELAEEGHSFGETASKGLEARLHGVIAHISKYPRAAPPVEDRPGIHVFPLIRYPYKVFYKVFEDRVLILHIRHASRRPWKVPR
jgi:toxin ParE1/3/4